MVGLPLASAALTAAQGSGDPEGPGMGERVGASLGDNVGTLAPNVGSAGGSLLGRAGSSVGGRVGRGIDKLVSAVRPKSPALGGGAATPGAQPGLDSPAVERVYTNAALGQPPEGMSI